MTDPKNTTPAVQEKNISDQVLAKIQAFTQAKALILPPDYSPENALKSAYIILQGHDAKPLETCTKDSVATCLLDMVVQGLSPQKNQCYFIPYGNKLKLSKSYFGSIAMAKRVGMKHVTANVIYEGDEFVYEIESSSGRKKIVKHTQNFETIDNDKIRGAYAITTMEDGTAEVTIMNMSQIKKAWEQGKTNGASPAHKNFRDEMAKKSVVQRACKYIMNTASDGYLKITRDEEEDDALMDQANTVEISFEDVSSNVTTSPPPVETPAPAPEVTNVIPPKTEAKVEKQAEMFPPQTPTRDF